MGHWQITSGCKVYQPLRLISWSESQSIQIYWNPPGPLNLDLSVPVFARSVYTVLPKQLVEKTQFWNPWAASPNALCALLAFAHCWPSRMGISHCQGARARFPGFGTWSQSGANQLRSHQPWEKNIAATWCNPQPFDNMLRGLDMLWYVFFPGQHGWQSNPFVLSYCMFMCLHGSASHAFHSEIFRIIWHMNAH